MYAPRRTFVDPAMAPTRCALVLIRVFGAQKSTNFKLVIGQGLKMTAIGILIGLLGALAVRRVMRGMLVDVAPTDPLTFAAMAALFAAIAATACWIPARRAAGLDPSVALRE